MTEGVDLTALPPMPPDVESLRTLEEFRSASSVLMRRYQFLRQANITFDGKRDMNAILGYKELLTNRDYRDRYERGGLAGKVVDCLPDAAWRGSMEVREDKDESKDTLFEQTWKAFDTRLQVQAKLLRVNKLSRLSNYACLLIGDGKPIEAELAKGNGSADLIVYLRPLSGGGGPTNPRVQSFGRAISTVSDSQISIKELDNDSASPHFGLPLFYQLNGADLDIAEIGRPVHYSRIIHCAEGCLEDDIYGQPALMRVYDLFDDLMKVTGGGAEAFWLRANAGLHLDVDKDMSLPAPKPGEKTELEKLKDQAEEYAHQMTRMMRTRGVTVSQLGSDVANFSNPADAIIAQIAGAKGIPKRILMGSEMGELASSQDRENWKDIVNGYQTTQLAPYLVRQLVDRLIAYNYLPVPAGGVDKYEVVWPHLQTMTEEEKDKRAVALAGANQAMGETLFTNAEIRDMSHGKAALETEEIAPIGAPVRQTDTTGEPVALEAVGHEFHGNQWTEGKGGVLSTSIQRREGSFPVHIRPGKSRLNGQPVTRWKVYAGPKGITLTTSHDTKEDAIAQVESWRTLEEFTDAEQRTLRALEAAIEAGDTVTIDEIIGVAR